MTEGTIFTTIEFFSFPPLFQFLSFELSFVCEL